MQIYNQHYQLDHNLNVTTHLLYLFYMENLFQVQ